jgi:hypothetical protein
MAGPLSRGLGHSHRVTHNDVSLAQNPRIVTSNGRNSVNNLGPLPSGPRHVTGVSV